MKEFKEIYEQLLIGDLFSFGFDEYGRLRIGKLLA
jgi:hypothetical protein